MSKEHTLYLFVRAFLEKVHPVTVVKVAPEFQSLYRLLYIQQNEPKRLAAKVKATLQDILVITEDWSPDKIASADKVLLESGAPSLTAMKKLRLVKLTSIFKKGFIKNDQQYEYVMSLLSDSRELLSDTEASRLEELSLQYEEKS